MSHSSAPEGRVAVGSPPGAGPEHGRNPEAFFAGSPVGWDVFQQVHEAASALGPCEVRVSKSQVAFRRPRPGRGFAYLWRPARYVRSEVPVVLSVALRHRLDSPRFKQVVHPSPTTWMHHLEVRDAHDVDAEVVGWLAAAYVDAAGRQRPGAPPARSG